MKTIRHKNKESEEKYFKLFEQFMNYISLYKTDFSVPRNTHLIFFDQKDEKLSEYSLVIQARLLKQEKDSSIVEITKTGSRTMPWRIAKTL